MNTRRILLRIMLASLAIAAVVGALAVFVSSTDVVWRIVATAGITALVCGILLPTSLLTDKARSRPAGLVAVAFLLVEYLLSLSLLWEVPISASGPWDNLGATTLLIFGLAIPMVIFTYWTGGKTTRWAGRTGCILASIVFLLCMIGIWADPWSSMETFGAAGGAVALFGAMIVLCLIGAQTGDGRWWRWLGIAAAAAALAITLWGLWHTVEHHDGVYSAIVSAAALIAYANLVMRASLPAGQRWVRWVALAAALVTAICADTQITLDRLDANDISARLGAAAGIVCGCATLGLAVLAALNRRIAPAPVAIAQINHVALTCPMCNKKQSLPVGGSACAGCGLRINIQLEEPHCPTCGYLLFGLKSERCPECGTAVAAAISEQVGQDTIRGVATTNDTAMK